VICSTSAFARHHCRPQWMLGRTALPKLGAFRWPLEPLQYQATDAIGAVARYAAANVEPLLGIVVSIGLPHLQPTFFDLAHAPPLSPGNFEYVTDGFQCRVIPIASHSACVLSFPFPASPVQWPDTHGDSLHDI